MKMRISTGEGSLRRRRNACLGLLLGLAAVAGAAAQAGGWEGELTASGVRSLEVEGAFFAVEITGQTEGVVEARYEFAERLYRLGVRVLHEQSGSRLRIWIKRPPGAVTLAGLKTPQLIIRVPASTQVRVENSSGKVRVAGLSSDWLRVETSSGSCEVENVTAELDITGSSGSLTVSGCEGVKTLETSSGGIDVRNSGGDIRAVSSSGSQSFTNIGGSIEARASSGSITVKDQKGTLDLKTSSGSLRGEGVTLTGDSSLVTTSGSIDFDFSNDIEDFSFDLRSSSGSISVGATRAKGTVITGSGPIRLRAESSSGSQTYR